MIGIIFGIDSSVFSTLQCIVFIGHIYGERMYKAIAKFKMATMTRIRDGPTGGLPSLCAMELCTRRKVKYFWTLPSNKKRNNLCEHKIYHIKLY